MEICRAMEEYGTQRLVFCHDRESGLEAIHDTTLAPALGGSRRWPYRTEDETIADVPRPSQGMTRKSAAMGLSLGSGKAVVLADPASERSEARMRAPGAFSERPGGTYVTAEDVGTTPEDMARATRGFSERRVEARIEHSCDQVLAIAQTAQEGIGTQAAALRLAERRVRELGRLRVPARPA